MTIGEASAVNTLIQWILTGRSDVNGEPIADAEAQSACRVLTKNAHKALYAGLGPDDVARRWPRRRFKGSD